MPFWAFVACRWSVVAIRKPFFGIEMKIFVLVREISWQSMRMNNYGKHLSINYTLFYAQTVKTGLTKCRLHLSGNLLGIQIACILLKTNDEDLLEEEEKRWKLI